MDGRTPSPAGAGRKYWEWSGKVQERGRCAAVLLYAMPRRTRLLPYVIVAAMAGPRPGHAQAPLTPLDSAILASQPLKRLVLSPSLFRRLSVRSEEHTSELQSPCNLVCRLLLEKKKKKKNTLLDIQPQL